MGLVGKVLSYLWRLSRGGWLGDQVGARIGSGGARLFTFIWLIFLIVAIVLVLSGFDLEAVDRWLDAHSSWFELIGDVLFRIFYGFVILLCGLTIYTLGEEIVFPAGRKAEPPDPNEDESNDGKRHVVRRGLGILLAMAIGYVAWVGMTMSD
ncbi:MAG TPA: hypothetical protein VN137_11065 [Sphingomonas sp.]|nr:hypothetical protein [Sphingomonas sp.]